MNGWSCISCISRDTHSKLRVFVLIHFGINRRMTWVQPRSELGFTSGSGHQGIRGWLKKKKRRKCKFLTLCLSFALLTSFPDNNWVIFTFFFFFPPPYNLTLVCMKMRERLWGEMLTTQSGIWISNFGEITRQSLQLGGWLYFMKAFQNWVSIQNGTTM